MTTADAVPMASYDVPDPDRDRPGDAFRTLDAFRETTPAYAQQSAAEPSYAPSAYPEPAQDSYPGRPGRPRRRPNKIIVIAAAAVIVLGAAGGAYAVVSSQHHGKASSLATETASIAASHAAPASTAPTATAPASAASALAAPATSAPASPTVSSGTVAVAADAASNPAAPQVTALVNRYFTAINQHDFQAYNSLFDQQMQGQNPQSSFDSGYATTTDSAEALTGISDTGSDGLAASLTFTSHQKPADSPDNSSCDRWSITLFLVPDGSGYLIGMYPSSYHASHHAC